jgi:Flp pilus assembly protein TadB
MVVWQQSQIRRGGERLDLTESLNALAEQNHYGVAFLVAYGATWVLCGIAWRYLQPGRAALVTLFQGMVAAPVALALSFATGALGGDRPVDDAITHLSILIGASQFLGLPFLIFLHARSLFTLVPYAFAAVCSMHFVLYSWLYQTPWYVLMSVAIVIGGLVLMRDIGEHDAETRATSRVCLFTGCAMFTTGAALMVRL